MSVCIFIIKVNENGLLSFLTEIPSFFNVQFPLDYPLLAALYSDVDCRDGDRNLATLHAVYLIGDTAP